MTDLTLQDLPGRRSRAELAARDRRRRRRRRSAVVLLLGLVLIGGAGWYGWQGLRGVLDSFGPPEDFAGPASGEATVQVQAGDSGTAIGERLVDAGVVASVGAFVDAAEAEPRAAGIQPGTYALQQEMPARDAVAALLDPARRVSLQVQVPEGFSKAQVLARVEEATGLAAADLQAAVGDAAALGLPPSAGGDAEGYLHPATYEFEPDATAPQVLRTMVDRAKQAIAAVGVPPEREREVVIIASIAEKEARAAEDFPKVTRVITNRLEQGRLLQLDSTVSYGTGSFEVTTTPEQRATQTPYNTYLNPGLPAGPISSPGEAALRAALAPEPGPWLFFVTVDPDTGETRFATTEEEHAANVELFRQWLREQE